MQFAAKESTRMESPRLDNVETLISSRTHSCCRKGGVEEQSKLDSDPIGQDGVDVSMWSDHAKNL
jgi:hypothetical protein